MKKGNKTTILNTESGETINKDLEIIYPENKDFEKECENFWSEYDSTIGKTIAENVESKSREIAEKIFPNLNGSALAKARNRFGIDAKDDLFQAIYPYVNSESEFMKHFVKNVCRSGALDDAYNVNGNFIINDKKILPLAVMPDGFGKFYLNFPNAQAVRNRYRMVVEIIVSHFEKKGSGTILSIACGSAQAVLHALYILKKKGIYVSALLTDSGTDSLNIVNARVKEFDLKDRVKFLSASFMNLTKILKNESENTFDLVEACGIADYLSDNATAYLSMIMLRHAKDKIVVSNMAAIKPHDQVLEKTYNWPLIYKTPEKLGQLVKDQGGKDVKVYVEPWGIHPVAVALK